MTIKIDDFQVGNPTNMWTDGEFDRTDEDVTYYPKFRRYMLTMVRNIMRNYSCDMVPVVLNAYANPNTNEYGHNFYVEVQYAKRGWQAVYAGTITPDGLTNITCYID